MSFPVIYSKKREYCKNIFSEHPKSVGLTYFQHMKLSLNLSYKLYIGSIKAFIHSFFNFFFIKSTTNIVNDIENQLNNKIL